MAEAKRARVNDAEDEGDGLENLGDAQENEALQQAEALQQSLDQVNEEASDRVLAVEQEFNRKRRPLYSQRGAALSRIPGFWKKVFMAHPAIRGIVSEADSDILDYLAELDIVESEDIKSGFSVKFTFAENPFFSNRELVRDIRFSEEGALQVTTTQIQWLPGAEPSGIEGGAAVGSKRSSPDNQYVLFSSWFTGRTETELEGHDDVADVLKEDIWPDPLRWHREAEETMADLFQPDDEGEEGEEFDDDEFDGDDAPAGEEGDEGVYVEERDEGEEVIEVADDDEGDDAQE